VDASFAFCWPTTNPDRPFGVATIETVRGVGYRLLGDAES
jgi:hypothetical protein